MSLPKFPLEPQQLNHNQVESNSLKFKSFIRMKCTFLLVTVGIFWICSFSSLVSGSYDSGPGYGVSHSSYPAAPVAHGHGQGWGQGQAAGSYYHYHVPLVGQNSHYHPQPQQSNDHHLYYLIPLLLLAALPLLLLPLLPLLLLPLGLSLLALLLPLLLMGGMMMMMMMDGGMMMMMMRNAGLPTRHSYNNNGESRAFGFGHLVLDDLSSLMSKYARSLDLDACPERLVCEAGSFIFPENGTESITARTLVNFLVERATSATPKGKARRLMRNYKQAFWTGSKSGNCTEYHCQPTFKIYTDSPPQQQQQYPHNSHYYQYQRNHNGTVSSTPWSYADYYSSLYGQHNKSNVSHVNMSTSSQYKNYYNSNSSGDLTQSNVTPFQPSDSTSTIISSTVVNKNGGKGKYKKHQFVSVKANQHDVESQFQPSDITPNVQVSYSDNANELRSAKS